MGFSLIVVATITQTTTGLNRPLNIENLIHAQSTTPLLWIIDTSPVFIAIMAGFAGFRQDQVSEITNTYLEQLETQTRLSMQLESATEELERRVEDRTMAIERRSAYLEAAADVGRAATSIYDLQELLPQVASFISERFGFYQVGIFILDEQNQYAVMRAASSEGGQRMLARNHQLKVGQEGIVGHVTGTGQARIALDVGGDAYHFDNPELPNTRSEMALPLFYGGRLFGALDVQSTESNAFSEDDISALRVLADQVSMAINNALLFEQLQTSIDSERRAYGDISRTAWNEIIKEEQDWG
jgi:GAF domain-containing protein